LKAYNKNLTNEKILVTKRWMTTEKRVDALKSLIIRNNINVDLLADRDSLKTILLMFSVNLNVTKIEEVRKMLERYSCAKKFTKLVVDVLRYLDKQLNPEIFTRAGVSKNKEELSPEKKRKNYKKNNFCGMHTFYALLIILSIRKKKKKIKQIFIQNLLEVELKKNFKKV